jgi:hypothetical protein
MLLELVLVGMLSQHTMLVIPKHDDAVLLTAFVHELEYWFVLAVDSTSKNN